jgi:hypothetical protein
LLELPAWTVLSPVAPLSLSRATSAALSVPTIWAWYWRPLLTSVTVRAVAPLTTWLLVSTRPLGVRIMPVPSKTWPLNRSWEVMSTIPGFTFLIT